MASYYYNTQPSYTAYLLGDPDEFMRRKAGIYIRHGLVVSAGTESIDCDTVLHEQHLKLHCLRILKTQILLT
jgi:hypothetical protein